MSIIAWIVLGLAAGLLANMLIPGKRSQGLILTCLIGIAGALGGGWVATEAFHVHTLHGFFNLSTWLTAIAGLGRPPGGSPPGHRAHRPPDGTPVNRSGSERGAHPPRGERRADLGRQAGCCPLSRLRARTAGTESSVPRAR